jgi:peptidyl-prolyl cis-trans isomerase A (cyclophilin A)/peptidyl-prolyl cis-trans isomerase B (cyclophilin B)
MHRVACLSLVLLLVAGAALAQGGNPRVRVETNKGAIVVELYPDKAPKTVENFLGYVKTGHYIGTIFHRVIPNFMIQAGGVTQEFEGKPLRPPVVNEANNGLSNKRGTIAMARTSEVNSATAQFFINLKDNTFLDFKNATPEGYGYCVFGKVVEGMGVVDKIAAIPTGPAGPYQQDVPKDPVVITKVSQLAGE